MSASVVRVLGRREIKFLCIVRKGMPNLNGTTPSRVEPGHVRVASRPAQSELSRDAPRAAVRLDIEAGTSAGTSDAEAGEHAATHGVGRVACECTRPCALRWSFRALLAVALVGGVLFMAWGAQ